MKRRFAETKEGIKQWYLRLSQRERAIVVVAIVLFVVLGAYGRIYQPIRSAFATQWAGLEEVQGDVASTSILLQRHAKLKIRRDEIEREYQGVAIRGGELSHLEKLVEEKVGLPSGQFSIKEGPVREFGGNYEQAPFTVTFSTPQLPRLVEFLKAITGGEKPLVLTRLDLRRTRAGDKLEVEVGVSSIRRKK